MPSECLRSRRLTLAIGSAVASGIALRDGTMLAAKTTFEAKTVARESNSVRFVVALLDGIFVVLIVLGALTFGVARGA